MNTTCLEAANESLDSWEHRRAEREGHATAVRRAESVLRILKNRSTLVDEAVRMGVDIETVADWLKVTLAAIGRALDVDIRPVQDRNLFLPPRQLPAS